MLLLAALSGGAAIAGGWDVMFHLAYVLVGFLGLTFLWAHLAAASLAVERVTTVPRSQVGRQVQQRLTLRTRLPLWLPWVEVRDGARPPASGLDRVVSLGPWAAPSWTGQVVCRRRGRMPLGPTRLATSDPFGLFRVERRVPASTSLLVLPETVPLSYQPLGGELRQDGGATARGLPTAAATIRSIRGYLPGDPLRHVHWPSTARHGHLMVREFEPEPQGDLWLVLDLESAAQAGAGQESTEEYAVKAAASLAAHLVAAGRAVGLASQTASLAPGRGEAHLLRLLELLAVARAQPGLPLADLLSREARRLHRAAGVVLITPAPEDRWTSAVHALAEPGQRWEVVHLEAASFRPGGEGEPAPDARRGPQGGRGGRHGRGGPQGEPTPDARNGPQVPVRRVGRGESIAAALSGPGRLSRPRPDEARNGKGTVARGAGALVNGVLPAEGPG